MSQQGENQLSQRRSQGDLSKLDNGSSLFESNHVCLSASDSALATSHLSSCNATSAGSNASNPPLLVDAVLSFIKAFRLKGDHGSIKRIVGERFSSVNLWTRQRNYCGITVKLHLSPTDYVITIDVTQIGAVNLTLIWRISCRRLMF